MKITEKAPQKKKKWKLLKFKCNNCKTPFSYRAAYFSRREYPYTCTPCIMKYYNRPNPAEKHKSSRYRHGHVFEGKKTKLYKLWSTMKDRCTNPNCKSYKYYGGKGIVFCERWNDFSKFKEDVEELGYREGFSILRIKKKEGYEPNNIVIHHGKGAAKFHRYRGNSLTLSELHKLCTNGLALKGVQKRLILGFTVEDALHKPMMKKRRPLEKPNLPKNSMEILHLQSN